MDRWIQENDDEINVKCCPKCKTLITKTSRYLNYIKKAYVDIIDVKKKLFGSPKDNDQLKNKISHTIQMIMASLNAKKLNGKFFFYNLSYKL